VNGLANGTIPKQETVFRLGEWVMILTARAWLIAAAVTALAGLHAQLCRADETPPTDAATESLPAPTAVAPPAPPAYVLPPPSWPTYTFPERDPLLDRPNAAQPGWYFNLEPNFVLVHLRNQLGSFVQNQITGSADFIRFPGNPIAPTISPRFEIGYLFPNNWGGIQLGYRFLTSQGSDQALTHPLDSTQGSGPQQGILNLNMVDLTYVSRSFSFGPYWNLRWGAGFRLMSLYFNSGVQFTNPGSTLGSVLAQNVSNNVTGFGVWAFGDLERNLPIPGLALFARVEGTDLHSQIRQGFSETVVGPNGAPLTFAARYDFGVGVPILREVVGASYTVPRWNYSRFMAGIEYESYFQIGRDNLTIGIPESRGQLDLYGLFFRAEFHF
jgi:hypothetical protein